MRKLFFKGEKGGTNPVFINSFFGSFPCFVKKNKEKKRKQRKTKKSKEKQRKQRKAKKENEKERKSV